MIVNTAQGGGGSLPLNLHVQPDEPAIKEGAWIQTPEAHTVKQIITKNHFAVDGQWNKYSKIIPNPPLTVGDNNGVFSSFGTEHYLFVIQRKWVSSDYNQDHPILWVFNLDTNTWSSGCVIWGTNTEETELYIYTTARKITYNISTQTATQTPLNIPNNAFIAKCEANSSKLCTYTIGNHWSTDNQYYWLTITISVYDIATNTSITKTYNNVFYQQITESQTIGTGNGNAAIFTEGGKLFLPAVNIGYSSQYAYTDMLVFDLTDASTTWQDYSLTTRPAGLCNANRFGSSQFEYDNKIYFPQGRSGTVDTPGPYRFCTFDLLTQTESTSEFLNYPSSVWLPFYPAFSVKCPNILFVFINANNSIVIWTYQLASETLQQDVLAILNGINHQFALSDKQPLAGILASFNDVWWYDTDFREYPTYIGDGTKFNKIKN